MAQYTHPTSPGHAPRDIPRVGRKMAAKRKSLAEELAELVDPAPLTFDPEHTDLNEATVARLADYKEEGSEEGETAARLRLRAGAALQELSEDPRYSGRAVSRRSLEEEEEESGECTCGLHWSLVVTVMGLLQ